MYYQNMLSNLQEMLLKRQAVERFSQMQAQSIKTAQSI